MCLTHSIFLILFSAFLSLESFAKAIFDEGIAVLLLYLEACL